MKTLITLLCISLATLCGQGECIQKFPLIANQEENLPEPSNLIEQVDHKHHHKKEDKNKKKKKKKKKKHHDKKHHHKK